MPGRTLEPSSTSDLARVIARVEKLERALRVPSDTDPLEFIFYMAALSTLHTMTSYPAHVDFDVVSFIAMPRLAYFAQATVGAHGVTVASWDVADGRYTGATLSVSATAAGLIPFTFFGEGYVYR